MSRHTQVAWQLLTHFGANWVTSRVLYAVQHRLGWFERKLPISSWDALPFSDFVANPTLAAPECYLDFRRQESRAQFFFHSKQRDHFRASLHQLDGGAEGALSPALEVLIGVFRCFGRHAVQMSLPPDWHRNPFTGQILSADLHWSRIRDFEDGDIKLVWETNRFAFTFALVRAYWRTKDERFAEVFWNLVEAWRRANPPQAGPNWKCGQEASFRVFAWCFGLYGFLDSPATTPERISMLAQMVAVHGRRIAAHLKYAVSQQNNHGISEAAGLWTIGLLFPELSSAAEWREIGRDLLERLGRELIYDDGAFSQHSANYHRLMLHDFLWAGRLGELNGQPLSQFLRERLRNAADLIWSLQDETSGRVPCFGQNDGALVLPLTACDHLDFRPVVQSTRYWLHGTRCWEVGPWDEELLWLFGPSALSIPARIEARPDLRATSGGCYTLRDSTGFVFVRCQQFRHRPSHADSLHVDLWWRGHNIAADAGTYSYNAPAPWNNPLAGTAFHNTVTVDGHDQMERVSRFVSLPWTRGRVRTWSAPCSAKYWEGEHDGYDRLSEPVLHRRGVASLGEGAWLVIDRLLSRGQHTYRLHWLVSDAPHKWDDKSGRLQLHLTSGDYHALVLSQPAVASASLVTADAQSPRGWRAPYYHDREPALSLEWLVESEAAWFFSVFAPEQCEAHLFGNDLRIAASSWMVDIALCNDASSTLVKAVTPRAASEKTVGVSG